MDQLDEPGLSFDQGADPGAVVGAHDQVSFPVAGHCPVGGFEATVVDAEHGLGERRLERTWRACALRWSRPVRSGDGSGLG